MNKFAIPLIMTFLTSAFIITEKVVFNVPKGWPKPKYDFIKNPLSVEKIELGRALFHDPILSQNNMISCASCHSPYNAFAHVDHALSHGIEDRIGTRNAPALMNLAWHSTFMWDGSINHLDMQSLFPITHPDEMNESIEHVVYKLQHSAIYPRLFYSAYQDSIITGEHTLKAISQFMLTLVSANSKYDSVMLNKAKFNLQERKGYELFKRHCTTCHEEPLFTNGQFENNGLLIDTTLNDLGRIKVTGVASDSLKFKVPTLRNVEFSYPYMHDGRFKRLSDVLNHYASGIHQSSTLSSKLQNPILLNSNDKVDLISFLLTLTDKEFLFNPKFSYPRYLYYPESNH
jgi:cytochrome c peroxidase